MLVNMFGEEITLDILEELGFDISEYSKNKMAKLVSETTNHHKRKGLSETKEQRKKLKLSLKDVHSKVKHTQYQYKEKASVRESILDEKMDTIMVDSQQNFSQDTKVVEGCDCGGLCGTKRCPCFKSGKKCGEKCNKTPKKKVCCTNK